MRLKDLGYLYSGLAGKSGDDFNVEDSAQGKPFVPFTNILNNFKIDVDAVRFVKMTSGELQNRVEKGDLLFLMSSEDYESIGKPAVVSDDVEELYLNSFCRGLRIKRGDVSSDYIAYFLSAESVREVLRLEARGFTRINLKVDRLASQEIRLPSLANQRRIVAYLDEKTAAIDARVAVLEKKLAAYKRLKTSVINRAVTRGLDPKAKLKDSGVDWIGKVPVGWVTRRVKDEGSAWNGLTFSPEDVRDEEDGVLVLRSSNIQNGKLCFDDNVYVDCELAHSARVRGGDILICARNGSRALVGKNALMPENVDAAFGAFMLVFRGGSEIDTRYAHYAFNAQMFESYMGGFATSTINQLLRSDFLNMEMPHPPLSEQRAIADYLDAECAKIDRMAALVTREIALYKNLKRSLVNEVVTGKREPGGSTAPTERGGAKQGRGAEEGRAKQGRGKESGRAKQGRGKESGRAKQGRGEEAAQWASA